MPSSGRDTQRQTRFFFLNKSKLIHVHATKAYEQCEDRASAVRPCRFAPGERRHSRGKGKVTVHAIKAYRDSRGTAPLILNVGASEDEWSSSRPCRLILGEEPRYTLNMRLGGLRVNPNGSQTWAGSL